MPGRSCCTDERLHWSTIHSFVLCMLRFASSVSCCRTRETTPVSYESSMQIAGLGTRGTGTCGTETAVLGHAELGQTPDVKML